MIKILILEPAILESKGLLESLLKREDYQISTTSELNQCFAMYNVIIFNNTNDSFPVIDIEEIKKFVENGGGILGVHDSVSIIVQRN